MIPNLEYFSVTRHFFEPQHKDSTTSWMCSCQRCLKVGSVPRNAGCIPLGGNLAHQGEGSMSHGPIWVITELDLGVRRATVHCWGLGVQGSRFRCISVFSDSLTIMFISHASNRFQHSVLGHGLGQKMQALGNHRVGPSFLALGTGKAPLPRTPANSPTMLFWHEAS